MSREEDALEALLAIAAGIAIGAGIVAILEMLKKQNEQKRKVR
jgi:tryptophan synthase alpha subunit